MTVIPNEDLRARSPVETFADDVRRGLSARQKSLPCKYFYDDVGAKLFDQITTLPEYYPTRTELAILRDHAGDIAREAGSFARLVELGSGEGEKTPLLLDAFDRPAAYVPVDISEAQLQEVAERFRARYPHLEVSPLAADYTKALALPLAPREASRTVAYFAGSTIGNFEPDAAVAFLARLRTMVGPGGAALVGVDLEKPAAVLEAAYDDAAGVTAAFNLNLLVRINRELGGTFERDAFHHRAVWEPGPGRIEMRLVSDGAQEVRVGEDVFTFVPGEHIVTEHCYKYTAERFEAVARAAGFRRAARYVDDRALFSLEWLVPA